MTDRPITFKQHLIPKILDDSKTQTRRTRGLEKINEHPDHYAAAYQDGGGNWIFWYPGRPDLAEFTKKAYPNGEGIPCPYGLPGDRLWVKETWSMSGIDLVTYKADGQTRILPGLHDDYWQRGSQWRSGRFMPKWASRIWLEITGVRAGRILDISPDDILAEGSPIADPQGAAGWFLEIWDSINKSRGFGIDINPWTWALTFKRITQ